VQPTNTSYDAWIGRTAYDNAGEKVGEITDVFYDDRTGRPEWLTIKKGMLTGSTFVPIHGSQVHPADDGDEDNLRLAFSKEQISDAPSIAADDGSLKPDQERDLWAYYGYDYDAPGSQTFGYGMNYDRRADQDFRFSRWEAEHKDWSQDQRTQAEHMETVPVQAQVEVPIEAQVRLRRYETTKQGMRTVQVPVTETEEHVEVEGVQAQNQRTSR
jgi:sporulation protein YlmC with PRC-barrel domain